MKNEFIERRAVMRQVIPVSIGFPDGAKLPKPGISMRDMLPKIGMTMGEVVPQVYQFRAPTPIVAWSLSFRRHHLVAAATSSRSSVQNAVRRNPNASAIANTTVGANALPQGFDFLMVRVPVGEYHRFRIWRDGFGVTDLIGVEPTWFERWLTRATGR